MKQLPKDDHHDEKQKLQRFAINCCSFKGIPNNSGVWKFGVKSWGEKFGDK
jgi:hypothetical protein